MLIGITVYSVESYTSQSDFCGLSCHIMDKPYKSWKESPHGEKDVACVECHYAPGEKTTLTAKFRGLGQLFSYLSAGDQEVRKRAHVDDRSCSSGDCHQRPEFIEKKLEYASGVSFTHKIHEEKQVEGQVLHCSTCHQHVAGTKHFEVPKQICHLCHFKNSEVASAGDCVTCHELPQKPLQSQKATAEIKEDEPLITHQSLKDANVPCESCHYELVLGDGEIKDNACQDCHDMPETLKKIGDMQLMHEEHVAKQQANCFNCHETIQHKESPFLDPARKNCEVCHPDHHIYQKMLLVGAERGAVQETPSLMFGSRTNCIGCHLEEKLINGEKVMHGNGQSCVSCHTEKHDQMLDRWDNEVREGLSSVEELKIESLALLKKATGKAPAESLIEANKMYAEANSNLDIVRFGNGVHNKKYSILLISEAGYIFEDLLDLLEEVISN